VRGKIALVIAIALGLIAVLGIRQILRQQTQKAEEAAGEQIDVLAAAEPIRAGTPLSLGMLQPLRWPVTALTRDNIEWGRAMEYVGQIVDRNLERGDPVTKSCFRQAAVGMATSLPSGMVAATIRVDDISGVAGMIRPGDHVDVLATLPQAARGGGGDVSTSRLLTNCVVIAVDNRTALNDVMPSSYDRGGTAYTSVTLAVWPKEAVLLTYVQGQGKITFAWRNRTDEPDAQEPPEITLTNVRAEAAKAITERKSKPTAGNR